MTYKRIFTFGCSYTEFIWPTWADIIGHDLNLPYENWGHAGTGNVYIAIKMLECDLKNKFTDTDLILVNWSSWHREDRMYPGGDIWASGGNVFNNEHYPVKFLKKYYSEYNDIVKTHLYPVMLLHTIDSEWFGGCKSLTQVGYLFYVLQNFRRAIKFQTTSWSII